jgi:hypothetical protein
MKKAPRSTLESAIGQMMTDGAPLAKVAAPIRQSNQLTNDLRKLASELNGDCLGGELYITYDMLNLVKDTIYGSR